MFGHRWLREADYDAITAATRAIQHQNHELHVTIEVLHERLIVGEGDRRSAMTMRDSLITRVNQLETEAATLRHKLTGLPQIAPRIEKGLGVSGSQIGAGVDLFEDVGDDKAKDLREANLLHDAEEILPFPSAAAVTDAPTR